jgi:Uma2 family endonuclease
MATAASETRCYTIHDLGQFPTDGRLRELVDGRIVEWDVTTQRHAFLEALLVEYLGRFVRVHRLGRVGTGEGMVRIRDSERDARGYDIAFYRRGRFPRDLDAAATVTTPDFVIEIISPTDRASMVEAKVADWLQAGVDLLWCINPETGTTTVYDKGTIRRVTADNPLNGGDVLPGLQLRLRELLDELDAEDQ